MGHDTAIFLSQPVDDNFICGICHDVLNRPTTVCADGHTFCEACLSSSTAQAVRDTEFRCPLCRSEPLAAFALNRPLQNMICALGVRCPHHDAAGDAVPNPKRSKKAASSSSSQEPKGCTWQGKLTELDAHLRSCPFEAVDCPLGCGMRATRDELDAHAQICPRRMVKCDQGCAIKVRADQLDRHKARDCPETLVKCSFCNEEMKRSVLGCKSLFISQYTRFDEASDKLTGHLATCPKIQLRCPHYGCYESFKREDAAAHHTAFAQKHACDASERIKDLEEAFGWERMEATFQIPVQKLAGDRNITLKSRCCTAAGYEVYIKLKAAAQTAPVNVFLCVAEPDWTPVKIKCLTITAPLQSDAFSDDAGLLEMGFNENGKGGRATNLEGSPDPSLGGPMKCTRKGARIGEEDEDSDAESDYEDYEWNEDTVTRKDLVDGATSWADGMGNVCIEATFWIQKVQRVTLGCR